jgi:hypothetical protein
MDNRISHLKDSKQTPAVKLSGVYFYMEQLHHMGKPGNV